ncbi:sugar-binding protein [Brevibacillus dissolubilis]|uniref:sugar-binding protein n=1 Tax=Brevibacillus dissolubilis TaxID=1844116 RepID=UPI00159BD7DF|nr:sugar-binding protein [Brevibacillus dissolubilis]
MRKLSATEYLILLNMLMLAVVSVFIYSKLSGMKTERSTVQEPLPPSKYHFALVYPEEKNPYWDQVKKGMTSAIGNQTISFEYLGPETSDMVEQLDLLNRAIASRVDGIIVQGMNEEAFTPVINQAMKRGIPVITIDSDAPASERIAYIGSDNDQAGVMVGEHLAEVMRGRGELAVILGNFHATNQRQRLKGLQKVLAKYPDMHLRIVQDSQADQFLAASLTTRLLTEYPELDAIVGLSAWDGPGIGQAVKRLQKSDEVYVVAFNPLPETRLYVGEGAVDAIVAEDPRTMGEKSFQLMQDVKQGKQVPSEVYTEVRLWTGPGLNQMEKW